MLIESTMTLTQFVLTYAFLGLAFQACLYVMVFGIGHVRHYLKG